MALDSSPLLNSIFERLFLHLGLSSHYDSGNQHTVQSSLESKSVPFFHLSCHFLSLGSHRVSLEIEFNSNSINTCMAKSSAHKVLNINSDTASLFECFLELTESELYTWADLKECRINYAAFLVSSSMSTAMLVACFHCNQQKSSPSS